jgi:type IV pilus assembly protein PilA
MQQWLRRMRDERAAGDRGFTLIEVLAVVVIIGILVAIAVPLYMNYRKGAANKSAESDVRGAITAVEQYYAENFNQFPDTATNSGPGVKLDLAAKTVNGVVGKQQTITVSPGNTIALQNNTADYVICGMNSDGGTIYVYNSRNGGPVVKSTQGTLAACASNGN